MIGTINPVVHGGRRVRWLLSVAVFAIACALSAGLAGGAFAACGMGLRNFVWADAIWGIVCVLCLAYALHEVRAFPLPRPQRRWQVPAGWRVFLPGWLTALSYGLLLGNGLLTYIEATTFYALVTWSMALASLWPVILVWLAYGASKAIPLATASWNVDSPQAAHEQICTAMQTRDAVHVLNGAVLAASGCCLMAGLLY